jgi:hypothetical protein
MGFFNDFIGSFTGSNERNAARKSAEGFAEGIRYTKEQIERSRRETMPLMEAAFRNINAGLSGSMDATNQALAAQLQLLGAGTEQLSPEGASNALGRGQNDARNVLMGTNIPDKKRSFTVIGTNPINVQQPEFQSPTQALAPLQQKQPVVNPLLGDR